MGCNRDADDSDWIQRVRSEGSVPMLHEIGSSSGWASPPGNTFMVRGSDYLKTRVKVPAGEYLLEPLGFDWLKGPTKVANALENPNNRIHKAIDAKFVSGDGPSVWAFNLQLPSKENYSAVAYFMCKGPIPEGSLMHRFLREGDDFRNSRLKLIANIVKGPWLVQKAVGKQAVCIIGRSLSSKYCISRKFFEVDIDIGSCLVARAIVHVAFGHITNLTIDLAFLIEGLHETELPEQILGAIRLSGLNPNSAHALQPSSTWDSCENGLYQLNPGRSILLNGFFEEQLSLELESKVLGNKSGM